MAAALKPNLQDLIDALGEPFDLWEHEYRTTKSGDDVTGYITYVGVEHAIARMNKVMGGRWSWTVLNYQIGGAPDKPNCVVHGRIEYDDDVGNQYHRDGIGAAQWSNRADDLDKIVKTAMADAFKKATHQFGMGGYLWDKGLADQIAVQLLDRAGKRWEARGRPKRPTPGNPHAAQILKDLKEPAGNDAPAAGRSEPVAAAPAPAAPAAAEGDPTKPAGPGAHPSEEWKAANRKFRGAVGAIGKAMDPRPAEDLLDRAILRMIFGIHKVESAAQLTADQLLDLAERLTNNEKVKQMFQTTITKLAEAKEAA